jgi:hypothetical protein
MAILEKEILINLHNNHQYYIDLGYEITKNEKSRGKFKTELGTKILVKVDDLPESSNIKVTKICDSCGEKINNVLYFSIVKQRKNNNGKDYCKKCRNRMKSIEKAKNNSLFLKYPDLASQWVKCLEEGCEEYTPEMITPLSNYAVLWKCLDCSHTWTARISDRSLGSGCPACWGRVVSDKNRLSLHYPELINEWHPIKNGDLTPNEVTYSSHKEIWWICKHGHEWSTPVHSRTIMKSNCPECAESKGEKRIRRWLESEKFSFIPQRVFNGLTGLGGKNLSYDFHLPEFNLLIEYQGEFHDGNGNEYIKLNLEKQQMHDERKRNYASEQNIDLLEIWYWDFDNIESILTNKLIKKEEMNV